MCCREMPQAKLATHSGPHAALRTAVPADGLQELHVPAKTSIIGDCIHTHSALAQDLLAKTDDELAD